ncbi:MAG: leucine--tRNA ligase [Clostridiales bacterium]|jgi:leucyl-tRNA synthetase|nr:leucine--tRNA ligase [Clostridiales bacterium]
MSRYDFKSIEKKWRRIWEENPINADDEGKPKFYCLDMFPYPSGKGLHVGHWRGYVIGDVLSRYKILQGYQVLHPMGWDAFGLPAENYAIKNNIHPSTGVLENVGNFRRQLKEISAVYDWSREINTTDPEFYAWTQWIFVQMFKNGLAYEKEMPLNWCPKCNAVLANEEAAGGVCERCGTPVTKKMLRQWMLKITSYAERLLEDLNLLDWPEKVVKMQTVWIGKSYGAEIDFNIEGSNKKLKVYTTRPDTLCGATFMVVSPEHSIVDELTKEDAREKMDEYRRQASAKSSVARMADKEKTGVFTGSYGINPINGKSIPIWVSDYVLAEYGTGAIMCVPAHDDRDFDFAVKFNLDITQVISPDGTISENLKEAYVGEGVLVNSEQFDGLESSAAIDKVTAFLEERGSGAKSINYKLRDWVFSRQRYWGEPIPIVHCEKCGAVCVPEEELPVLLPDVASYQPTSTGESPLSSISDWVNTSCPACGGPAKRETNTMPQWAGSSWYFLRYADPHNTNAIASPEALKKWLPVDYYIGGVEHAVLHLLYARFYTKFLYDIGVVDFKEPFLKLFNQGMITNEGRKMDKSGGNGVSPDDIVSMYGCDSLRMYEMFIGPPELDSEWDQRSIEGVNRYLNKVWKLIEGSIEKPAKATRQMEQVRHKMIYEITSRLDHWSLNTVISGFMEYTNKLIEIASSNGLDKETMEDLIIMLSPFAPHISEELWHMAGGQSSVFKQRWPIADPEKMKESFMTIAIQIGGKLRDTIEVASDSSKEEVILKAKGCLGKKLENVQISREIYVPGRIVNFVIK